jgi:tetratricopeptide (TPR) repeat protein
MNGDRHMPRVNGLSLLPALLCSLIALTPAIGKDQAKSDQSFAAGCDEYSKGDFQSAKTHFVSVLRAHPTFWKADYQLGNTNMQLRNYAEARRAYNACLQHKPDVGVEGYCHAALSQIDKLTAPPAAAAPATAKTGGKDGNAPSEQVNTAAGPTEEDGQTRQVFESKKNEIMQRAERQCEAVRAEGQQRINDLKASANSRYLDENGAVVTDISPEDRAQVEKEIQDKTQRIMQDARNQIDVLARETMRQAGH